MPLTGVSLLWRYCKNGEHGELLCRFFLEILELI